MKQPPAKEREMNFKNGFHSIGSGGFLRSYI
jgi:hypothetical protein